MDLEAMAAAYVAEIDANVEALYSDRLPYEVFGVKNRETWDKVRRSGCEVEVSKILCERRYGK